MYGPIQRGLGALLGLIESYAQHVYESESHTDDIQSDPYPDGLAKFLAGPRVEQLDESLTLYLARTHGERLARSGRQPDPDCPACQALNDYR